MGNSIKDCLTPEDTISEIKLIQSGNKKCACVVVEGESDMAVLHYLLNNAVNIFQSYGGKREVDRIVNFFNCPNILGIRDRDYAISEPAWNIFFYDFCCLEMMIVSSDNCFGKMASVFCRSENLHSLRASCLNKLCFLSNLRKLNEINHWNLNLSKISPGKYEPEDDPLDALITEIKARNQEISDLDGKIRKARTICTRRQQDQLNITNGHDFISVFWFLAQSHGTNCSINDITRSLYTSYEKSEFKHSILYSKLHAYQTYHNLIIVT